MTTRVLLACAFVAAVTAQSHAQTWHSVESRPCGFVVQVPAGWTVQPVTWDFGSEADCAVGLRPPDWLRLRAGSDLEIPEFAIYVGVSTGTLETACKPAIVCRDARGWYFEGRAGARGPARGIRTKMGPGVRGDIETGSYSKQDGYAGEATAFIAVLNHGRRLAEFIADNKFQDEATFDRIVRTFEFR